MLRFFRGSILFAIVCFILAAIYGWSDGHTVAAMLRVLWIVLVLSVLEVSLSFDNAVVNATVLKDMDEVWQRRFLTWGMVIAVYGMYILFPLAIVAVAAGIGPVEAVSLSLNQPEQYEKIVSSAHISIAGFGGAFLGISDPIWSNIIGFVLLGFLFKKTLFGKTVLAVGGNEEAALLAGPPVTRIKIAVFVLQGLFTGFAGVMLASRMSLGDPKTSVGLELNVISACVLGGVSLTGGVTPVSGVLVGVLIMGSVQNAMSRMNVPTFHQ